MERKMRNRSILVDFLIALAIVLLMLLSCKVFIEVCKAKTMVQEAEKTDAVAEVVIVRARAVLEDTNTPKEVKVPIQMEVPVEAIVEPPRAIPYWEEIPLEADEQVILLNACEEFGVPFSLALGVMEQESRFTMVSGDGGNAAGYFQVWEKWWATLMEEIGVNDLSDPEQNIRTGCAVLGQLLTRYGNERDALSAYNTGKPGATKYATEVLGRMAGWEEILCLK
jgi:soluble lytic murein transglycosylase-like protein